MISRNEYILLGTITKPHGTKGGVLLWLTDIKADEIRKMEQAFIEKDGLPVPFFIEDFRIHSSETIIVKFEGIDSETKAKIFAGDAVYVFPNQLRRDKRAIEGLISVKGYRVNDVQLVFVGFAEGIIGIDKNPLLQVVHEGREYLVPVHEDIIREVNDKTREITIEAPEGLFEL
jgi:16S rRNA processing protein RimM